MLKRLLVVAVVVAALGALAVTGPAAQRTYMASDCTNAAFKPKRVVIACADAGFIATGLSWSQWSDNQAKGTGTGKVEVCEPSCAAGHTAQADVRLRLFRPRYCSQDGKRHFTKLEYVWPQGEPSGGAKQGTVPFPCSMLET